MGVAWPNQSPPGPPVARLVEEERVLARPEVLLARVLATMTQPIATLVPGALVLARQSDQSVQNLLRAAPARSWAEEGLAMAAPGWPHPPQ